jgi:hypothetical protein
MKQMNVFTDSSGGSFLIIDGYDYQITNYEFVDMSSVVNRRPSPYFGSPDFRIFEMNKRLQQRSDVSLFKTCVTSHSLNLISNVFVGKR